MGWIKRYILTCCLCAATTVPAFAAVVPDQQSTGETLAVALSAQARTHLPTANDDLRLLDKQRQKTLAVNVTYPTAGGGSLPVIVFSHGAGGNRDSYSYLMQYWAEHGYVCIQPAHDDSVGWNREQRQRFSMLQYLQHIPQDPEGWVNRARDVSFVIDALPEIERQIPQLAGRLDGKRIAVAGHSYGAFTSMVIGGAALPDNVAQVSDSRVKAIVAISPQGIKAEGNKGLGFDSPQSYSIGLPALFVTGDRDQSGWNSVYNREDAFRYSPPGDKYFMTIDGASHMTFAGVSDGPQPRRYGRLITSMVDDAMGKEYGDHKSHLDLVEQGTTLFLDAYVKGDRAALGALKNGALPQLLTGKGRAEQK
jgi:predicted dienelactone hydrolase